MFMIAFIIYMITILLGISTLVPSFWENTNVPSVMGLMLIFATLSLIMLLRKRVKLFQLITVYIAIIMIVMTFIEGVIMYYSFSPQASASDPEYIIVTGSGMFEQNKLTIELESRLKTAIVLSQEYPKAKMILSGGVDQNRGLPQSIAMRTYLTEQYQSMKIKPPQILMEERALTLYESIKFSNDAVQNQTKKPIQQAIIIIGNYQCAAAKLLGVRLGMTLFPKAAPLPFSKYPVYFIKETVSLSKSVLFDGFFNH